MSEKQPYSYTVLRYVHDVVSGESLNVGIVMHAPKDGFLKIQTRKTIRRLKQVFPDLDRHSFLEAMKAVKRGILVIDKQAKDEPLFGGDADARTYALKVLPADDSALQWSSVGTGLTTNVEKTFERLFQRFVARYDQKTERRRTDDDIWRPVQEKLTEREVHVSFKSKVVAGTQDRITFEKAWKNGRWHAYEPISFDLADESGIMDKARRWRGHLSAVHVGSTDDVALHFILGRPQEAKLTQAYEDAKKILEGADFTAEVVDEDDVDDFVEALEAEFRLHEAGMRRSK